MGFTATDSVENAEKIYMMLGRPLTRSNGKYIIERTWVKAVIDGKEYQLDVNFKKFTPAGSISDEIKAQNFDLDFNNYTTLSECKRELWVVFYLQSNKIAFEYQSVIF